MPDAWNEYYSVYLQTSFLESDGKGEMGPARIRAGNFPVIIRV